MGGRGEKDGPGVCAPQSLVAPEVSRDPANLKSPQPAQPSLTLYFPTSWLELPPPALSHLPASPRGSYKNAQVALAPRHLDDALTRLV